MIAFLVICVLVIVAALAILFDYKDLLAKEKNDEAKELDEMIKRCKEFKDKEK